MSFFLLTILFLSIFIQSTLAADIYYAGDQRALVIRDRLYFMGGEYLVYGNDSLSNQQALYWLDLNSSFPVESQIRDSFLHDTSISTTPYMAGGAFWADTNQTRIYTIGGFLDDVVTGQSTLQAYKVQSNVWQSISVSGGAFNMLDRHWSMYASTFNGGGSLSFISGGRDFLRGMVVFDSTNPEKPSWTNVTDDGIPYFWGGTTQYVRYGSEGILVSVGGFLTESTPQLAAQRREMNSIQIYDIASKKWTTIFATGDIPPARSRLCSALSAAPDDSSFHMIIHGGWDEEKTLDDMYMLIMPAFEWVKINTTSNEQSSSSTNNEWMGRTDHFCSTYKDRQMLVLGGRNALNFNISTDFRDYPTVRMLDMSTFEWQTRFPLNDTTYQIPQAVIDVVGGGPTGGAKAASTWQQTLGDNEALFSKTITRYDPDHPPKATNTLSGNQSATVSSAPTGSTTASKGAIAGGVVGGVAGLGLVGAAIYFLLVRRRRRQRDVRTEDQARYQPEQQGLDPAKYPATRFDYRHEVEGDNNMKIHLREMDGESSRLEAPARQSHKGDVYHELGQ